MERAFFSPGPFRFTDPRQREIYEDIQTLIGPGPAAFFRDACWMMANQDVLLCTAHLVAHCLREVESALRRVLRPISMRQQSDDQKTVSSRDSHRDQIQQVLQSLEIGEDTLEAKAWLDLSKNLHGLAHRRALEPPPDPEELQEIWDSVQAMLIVVLPAVRDRAFLNWFPVLDEMLATQRPTEEDVKRLANEIPNNVVTRNYFFSRLESPEWLEPLWKQGFFIHPPSPERDEEEGTVRFPPWPEAKCLARMAKHKPEVVACIIRKMPDTENVLVHSDLVDAALAMPPEISAPLVEKMEKWAKTPYPLLSEGLGELIAHWAKGGQVEEAMRLARVLLDVLPDERKAIPEPGDSYALRPKPRSHFDMWHYEWILKNHYPSLVRSVGLPALEMLCDLLEKAVQLSRRHEEGGPEDYSVIWHPAIDDHPEPAYSIESVLVAGVRDAAELVVRSGNATVEQVVEILERRCWKVFRRIALHILRLFSERAWARVVTRLTDRALFEDTGVRHEYILLLRAAFPHLPEQDQQTILNWINGGPDEERSEEPGAEKTSTLLSAGDLIRHRELWQSKRLAWIGRANLPAAWQGRYDAIIAKHGELEHPEFPVYREFREGPISPKTAEELKAMSVEEIVTFLNAWKAPGNAFAEPSPEGLGRVLASIVADDPQRFAASAMKFQGLDPTYVRALLSGLRGALKERVFEWGSVLRLCQWVVDQPREIPGRNVGRLEADPDPGWTRMAIADLLSTGLKSGSGEIPIAFRGEVWNILEELTHDPEPTPAYEEQYGGSNMDPATLSINTVRGEAMHAVSHYALWVRRHMQRQADASERLARGFDEMPEVRPILEAHLNIGHDPSPAIHAVYGQWYPWLALLDRGWAEAQKGSIFPLGEESQTYFRAAWNAYIILCPPCDYVFDSLRDVYMHAVERLGTHDGSTKRLQDPDEKLAEHLMVYYGRGKIDLKDPMLVSFWQRATDALRAYAIRFIGNALTRTEDAISEEILNRLQNLWHERLSQAQVAPQQHQEEISAFGWWFVSSKFDSSWSIAELLKALRLISKTESGPRVIRHLAKVVTTHPRESIECLRRIIEGDREGWNLYRERDRVRQILHVGLQSPITKKETEAVIHYLGSRGFLEYRDLLEG